MRHFLDIADIAAADLKAILADAAAMKAARAGLPKGTLDSDPALPGRALAMIFEKSSTRTRVSFDMAIRQLGGSSLVLNAADMQLGRGESIPDTAKVLSRFVDAVMIRANAHEDVTEFAHFASVPVINGLTDRSHPCQIVADLLTLQEHFGDLGGLQLAWVGDGNNVAASFIHAAAKLGFELTLGCPDGYAPFEDDLAYATNSGAKVELTTDPRAAVAGADVVIADTFVSMGDTDADKRLGDLAPYSVTQSLMEMAKPKAVFLHCLPAHRGEEVSAAVIDGPRSLVFDEAENRLHGQKAILKWCFAG
jgi:ornithine carbamoyltransferase